MASTQRQSTDLGRRKSDQAQDIGNKDKDMDKGQPDKSCASHSGNTCNIKEHMDVVASCGTKVGVVDRVEGHAIKLTKHDSKDNQHHFIPTDWVANVDEQVHLKKNSKETEEGWKSNAESCGSCS